MSTSTSHEREPKRVILRLRTNEFEGRDSSEYNDPIKAYLAFAGRSTNELEENKHYAHIEPFQAPELQQTVFHITLDIEKDSLDNPNFQTLPHEIYRVRRDIHGKFQVKRIQNPLEEKNYITRMRKFTDSLYAWAK
ncbi:hypothetical protein H2199_005771 [Coniosporium tulheliwenetii]|uniref:Uncharacterized protein n=1 Tax=Coniosporium tulheliwenetii TaxID=3383036 RepID=A0ACC2Z0D8_9PEZI|nr:hypothetical protein H2199_005771 [Cladosporium sp. JES 115]